MLFRDPTIVRVATTQTIPSWLVCLLMSESHCTNDKLYLLKQLIRLHIAGVDGADGVDGMDEWRRRFFPRRKVLRYHIASVFPVGAQRYRFL